jgi:hypothetical protein
VRWPLHHREGHPSADAQQAVADTARGLVDADNLACRLEDATERLAQTRERNHFAAAVARAIRGA